MPAAPQGCCWKAETKRSREGHYIKVELWRDGRGRFADVKVDEETETIWFFGSAHGTPESCAIKAAEAILARRAEEQRLSDDLGIEVTCR